MKRGKREKEKNPEEFQSNHALTLLSTAAHADVTTGGPPSAAHFFCSSSSAAPGMATVDRAEESPAAMLSPETGFSGAWEDDGRRAADSE